MSFTHIDADGNAVMVDVAEKAVTRRRAVATGRIRMGADAFARLVDGSVPKGDVLGAARVAGILAAKGTASLIPLCHGLSLTSCAVAFTHHPEDCALEAVCTAQCDGKTGVEMEALTGVTVALLTVYDMCKALNKRMVIEDVHLVEKEGGKSGRFLFEDGPA